MQVVHVNIPAFAVAAERRVDARLRGRPAAIAASSSVRAPLVAVSAEAFAAGICAGEALKVEPRRAGRRRKNPRGLSGKGCRRDIGPRMPISMQ